MKSLHEEGGLASAKSLRDEFAGLAMVAIMAAETTLDGFEVAEMAYRYADAMLAARKEQR